MSEVKLVGMDKLQAKLKWNGENRDAVRAVIQKNGNQMNEKMKTALERNGFVRCGIIFEPDGTERVAYQRVG